MSCPAMNVSIRLRRPCRRSKSDLPPTKNKKDLDLVAVMPPGSPVDSRVHSLRSREQSPPALLLKRGVSLRMPCKY